MDKVTIDRTALGSVACMGDLYDARLDNFCGISVFKEKVSQEALTTVDTPFCDIQLVHSENISEKFDKLDVKAGLQVSVLAGMFTLGGSGRYLSDQKTSARSVKSSLLYNIKTKEEKLNIFHNDLKEKFACDAIKNVNATHIVVGISWGANSVISFQYENKDNRNVKEIEGNLSASLKTLVLSFKGEASGDYKDSNTNKSVSFEVKIYGDILPKNEELSTTPEGALNLMKQLPKLVENYNGGKGKPLTYRLIPISLLKDRVGFEMKVDTTLKSLEEASLIRVVQLFEQVASSQQQINDFYEDTLSFQFCVPDKDVVKIGELKNSMKIGETSLRTKLSSVLTAVRSGKSDAHELEKLILEFENGDLSPEKVSAKLATWGSLIRKINFARTMVSMGAKYVGTGVSFDDEISRGFDKKTYAIFFTQSSSAKDDEQWKGNRQLFLEELKKKNDECQYLAVDCDIYPDLMPKGSTSCVQILYSGIVVTEDLLEELNKMASLPWARATGATQKIAYLPNNRVSLSLPCTGNNCDPLQIYEWNCEKCKKTLEFGFDDYVYCACGKSEATCMEYRCPDPNHGINFESHSNTDYLKQLLGKLRPFKEMNILILGETGVGKSTWINGFINYLTYDSLEDAEDGELCTLIPSEFTIWANTSEGVTENVVRTGTDENEVFTIGHSSTQSCKVYSFPIDNTTIRLIDTPGIGDSRGYEQDKRNFENILNTLSFYKEIHGICILLKPTNARLTVMFRFCINELLRYLHRDASKNIMFCFTNTRGTCYQPGDTFATLRNLLSKNMEVQMEPCLNTIYCYDSESYRYLAALKNNPPVTLAGKEFYSKSWKMSATETKRMLQHIRSLEPHPIQNTMNLNHAREMVLALTRPLAEISRNIQINKVILERERKRIEETKATTAELMNHRFTTVMVIEKKPLSQPKVKCPIGDYAGKIPENETLGTFVVCDNTNIRTEHVIEWIGLFASRQYDKCRHCGHTYRYHVHFCDYVQKKTKVEDQAVKKLLKKHINEIDMKVEMISEKNRKIAKLEAEQREIEKASAKFAYFLKHNAITPHNDGMKDYLEHLIREEKGKLANDGSEDAVIYLEANLASYLSQKEILDREMKEARKDDEELMEMLDPKEIMQLVEELKELELTGGSLKDALECFDKTRMGDYREVKVISHLDRNGKSKGKKYRRFWKNEKAITNTLLLILLFAFIYVVYTFGYLTMLRTAIFTHTL